MELATKVILSYYLLLNLVLFCTMAYDKLRAKKGGWRVPESTLFIMALLGGGVGGFFAMWLCHHKNRKIQFYIIYGLTVVLHCAFIYVLLSKIF